MELRRSLRRATVAAAVLTAAVGAVAAAQFAVRALSGERTGSSVGARLVSAAVQGGRRGRVLHGRRRPRSLPDADDVATAPKTAPEVGRSDLTDGRTGRDLGMDPAVVEAFAGQLREFDPASSTLQAAPDLDAAFATPVVRAVAPGRPPELALTAFVAEGLASVNKSAELVIDRKPQLDEGVAVSLEGRVVDADGDSPIAGAVVVVSSTFYVRQYQYDHHLREVAHVVTDATGGFLVERLNVDPAHFGDRGNLFVSVTAEGRAPASSIAVSDVSPGIANRLPNVVLQRAARTLRGHVLDMWAGKPVVGARVYATGAIDPTRYPKDERAAVFVGASTTTTDADGRFVLVGLGDGVQTVSLHTQDDCIAVEAIRLPRDGEFEMRSRRIGGRIEGTVLDERGEPVALAKVVGGENMTHSFADGRFVLENFRGDVVTVFFQHPDFEPTSIADVRDGAAGLVVHMERPRPTIVLDVRDTDTRSPIPRIRLDWTFADQRDRPATTSPEHLAKDGRYVVRVPKGATSVAVTAADRVGQAVSLEHRADGEVVDVRL